MSDNSVRTAKKTPHFAITKIKWLTLFREIIVVYTKNNTKHKYEMCTLTVERGSTYIVIQL
jgi:hypothetical protein